MFLTELHSFLEACSSWQLLKLLGCLGAVLRSHRFPACASKLGRKVWISSVMPHTSCQALVRPQSIRQRVSDVYRALWLFVLCISPNTQTLKSLSREQFWMGRDAFAIIPRTTWIWELQAADIAYAPVQDQLPRLREWQGSSYLKGWSRFWLDCTEWFYGCQYDVYPYQLVETVVQRQKDFCLFRASL